MDSLKLITEIISYTTDCRKFEENIFLIQQKLAEYANLSNVNIYLNCTQTNELKSYKYSQTDNIADKQKLDNFFKTNFNFISDFFQKNSLQYIDSFEKLPKDIHSAFKSNSNNPIVILPIIICNDINGFLFLELNRSKKKWDQLELSLVISISNIISNYYANFINHLTLKQDKNNFKYFIDSINDMVLITNFDGKLLYANNLAKEKLGYKSNELIQIIDLYPESLKQEILKLTKTMTKSKMEKHKLEIRDINKEYIPISIQFVSGKWNNQDCIYHIAKNLSNEKESKLKFSKLFQNNPAAMALSDLTNKHFVDVNSAFIDKLGYTLDEIIGKTSVELELFIDPEKHQHAAKMLKTLGVIQNVELQVKCKDNSIIDGLFSGEVIESEGKSYFLTVMVDITKQKQLQYLLDRETKRLNSIIEATRLGTWEWDLVTGRVMINNIIAEMLGYPFEKMQNMKGQSWADFTHPDDLPKIQKVIEEHFNGKSSNYTIEFRMKHKNNDWIWVYSSGTAIERDENEKPLKVYGIQFDISERKNIENNLRHQKNQLELVIDSTLVGIWDWQVQTGYVEFNERWAEIIGYSLEELKPIDINTWINFVHPDDLKLSNEKLNEYWDGKSEKYVCEARMKHKNGNWVWVLDTGKTVEWEADGKPKRMIGTHLDISDQKTNEEKIRKYKINLEEAEEIAHVGYWELNLIDNSLYCSDEIFRIFGITADKFANTYEAFLEFVHPEDRSYVREAYNTSVKNKLPYDIYHQILRVDSEVRFVHEKCRTEYDEHGKAIRSIATVQDITELLKVNDKLLDLESYYRELFHNMNDGIIVHEAINNGKDFLIKDMNLAAEKIINYNFSEIYGKNILDFFPELNDSGIIEVLKKVYKTGNAELFIFNPKNERMNFVAENRIFKISKNKVVVFLTDITKRRNAEIALMESERKFKTLFFSVNEAFCLHKMIYDSKGKAIDYEIIDVNPLYEVFTGINKDKALGARASSLYDSNEAPYLEIYAKVADSGKPCRFETYFSPMKKHFKISAFSPLKGEFATLFTDISQQKENEVRLEKYRVNLEEAGKMTHIGFWEFDLQNNDLYWSDEIYRIMGLEPRSFNESYETFLGYVHPEDREYVTEFYNESVKNKMPYNIYHRIQRKNGEIRYVHEKCRTEYDDNGTAVRSLGIIQDITEQIKDKERILETQAYYRGLFQNMTDGVIVHEATLDGDDFVIKDMNLAAEKITDYSLSELLNKPLKVNFSGLEKLGLIDILKKVNRTGKSELFTFKTNNKKTNIFIENKIYKISDNKIVSVITDISQRQRAEAEKADLIYKLNQRVKEINCLYQISKILFKSNKTLESLLDQVVNVLPMVLKFEKYASCYVYFKEKSFLSIDKKRPKYSIKEEIISNKKNLGFIELGYTNSIETSNELPDFLNEELRFLKNIKEEIKKKYDNDLLYKEINKLSKAVEQSANSIVITDVKGNIEYVNNSYLELSGYKREEVINKESTAFISDEKEKKEYEKEWDNVLKGNEWRREFLNKKKNGELYWESSLISPIFDKRNKIINVLSIKEDISKLKETQIELENTKILLESVFEQSPLALAIISYPDAIIELINPSCLKLMQIKLKKHEYLGKSLLDLEKTWKVFDLNDNEIKLNDLPIMMTLRGKETIQKEMIVEREDLSRKIIIVNGLPIYNSLGEQIAGFIILQDITDLKLAEMKLVDYKKNLEVKVQDRTEKLFRANQELKRLVDKEKELNRLKNEFTNNVNHELRNPLTSILLVIDILKTSIDEFTKDKILERIYSLERSATRLLELIEELLDLSRLESNKMVCNLEIINLKNIFYEVFEHFRDLFEAKKIDLKFSILDEIYIKNDKEHLLKILSNLLSNSYKFTNTGSVEVFAKPVNKNISISVIDTGIGINDTELDHIFDRFERGSNKQTNIPGTGIGLNIVKRLSQKHGGEVNVISKINKGTTFTINLPIESKWYEMENE